MEDFRESIKETLEFFLEEEKRLISLLASLPRGTIRKKKINGHVYYYLKYRKGEEIVEEYLGSTIPEDLVKKLRMRKEVEKELAEIRKNIVYLKGKIYKNVSLIKPLEEFLKILTKENLWDEGIEIIGAWCFYIYERFLPIRSYPVKTQDIDILIPYPYKGKMFDIANHLKHLGFREHINPDYSTYFTGYGLKIEFIAPEKGRGHDKSPYIKQLGVSPQMLRYMNILFEESMVISIARGVKVRIPSPSAFVVHKLLVASRRKTIGKKEKDLKQAIFTAEYVLKKQEERDKFIGLLRKVPKIWLKTIRKNLVEAKSIIPQETEIADALVEIMDSLPHKT